MFRICSELFSGVQKVSENRSDVFSECSGCAVRSCKARRKRSEVGRMCNLTCSEVFAACSDVLNMF